MVLVLQVLTIFPSKFFFSSSFFQVSVVSSCWEDLIETWFTWTVEVVVNDKKIVDEHVSRVWKKKRVNWNEGRINSLSKSNFYDFSVSNEPFSRTEREMLLLSDPSSNTCLLLSHFILFFSFQTPLKCSNGGKMGRGWEGRSGKERVVL